MSLSLIHEINTDIIPYSILVLIYTKTEFLNANKLRISDL